MAEECRLMCTFQSTLPVWGATTTVPPEAAAEDISIHAPRVGSDFIPIVLLPLRLYFNPRSPCGERLTVKTILYGKDNFNPRSPCGERLYVPVGDDAGV